MTNWKNIHPLFTKNLQTEWENRGFSYEQCKEWIDAGLLFPDESDLAHYLVKKKGYTPERFLEDGNLIKYKEECKELKKPKKFNEGNFREHLLNNSQEKWFSTENDIRYKEYFPISFWKNWQKEESLKIDGYDDKPTVSINGLLIVPAKAKFYRWLIFFLVTFLLPLSALLFSFLWLVPWTPFWITVGISPALMGLIPIFLVILRFSHWFDTKIYFELNADGSRWEKEGVFLQFYKSSVCEKIARNICQWSNEIYEIKKENDWKKSKELSELNSQLIQLQQNETNTEISEIIIADIENKLTKKEELLIQKEQELKNSLRTSKKSTVHLRREINYLKKLVDMKQALTELKEKSEIFEKLKLDIILKEKEIEETENAIKNGQMNLLKKFGQKQGELAILKKRLEELETVIMEQKRQLIINIGKIEVNQGHVIINSQFGDNTDLSYNENIYQLEQSTAQIEIAGPSYQMNRFA